MSTIDSSPKKPVPPTGPDAEVPGPAPARPETAIHSLRSGQAEKGMRVLIRWPDKACAHRADHSFKALWLDLRDERSDDPLEEAALRHAEGLCAYRAGQSGEACDAFRRALRVIPSVPVAQSRWALQCGVHWSLALGLRRVGDLDEAVSAARKAANEARQHDAHWLEGAARLALGRVLRYVPGENARARASFDEAHRLLSACHPPDPLGLAYVRAHEARLALDAGNAHQSLALLREARTGFGRSHHHRALAHSQIDQGWAHIQLRALAVARACGEDAIQDLRAMGDGRGVLRALQLLAQVSMEEGRSDEALRTFEEIAQGAAALGDTMMHAEALVGIAWTRFHQGRSRSVLRALQDAQVLLSKLPVWTAAYQHQALDVALSTRRGQFETVPDRLRRLRGALIRRGIPRLTAECMSLCGFELARQGRLAEAAPVLKEALSAASQADAVGWTERFLRTVSKVDVRQWITSLATEMSERAHLAEEYAALRICAVAGLHDVKNLASAVHARLELFRMQTEDEGEVPDAVLSSAESAMEAGRLAAEVEMQIIAGRTQLVVRTRPVDPAEFLAQQKMAIERMPGMGDCSLRIEKGVPPALADERYLARVFGNLKSNAETYAKGSDIILSARLNTVGKRREVIVGFEDNGQGIDPEDAEILFNAFKNPDEYRQKRANRGTGFGLHYCKLVIEAHGGRMWVDPRPGQGAAFYFTLAVAD